MGSPGLSNPKYGQQQRLGITDPISLGGPTEDDVIKTRELEKVSSLLAAYGIADVNLFTLYH